ncbi:MAG: 30S ribosomal protein S8 [Desulfobacteraceae bacterium]|nr:30S ribosomal protein S8 [Desulfobacteraceae bacterium]
MSMSDPLADMLTRIRNAVMVHLPTVDMPYSKMKAEVARILKQEGYVDDYQKIETQSAQDTLRIVLKANSHADKVISGIKRISKPGRRIYARHDEIPKVLSGLGISILSTSAGIITDHEARSRSVGGEILCQVW